MGEPKASLQSECQRGAIEELTAEDPAKLEELVRERKGYDRARRRAVARLRVGLDLGWTAPRSRGELHER